MQSHNLEVCSLIKGKLLITYLFLNAVLVMMSYMKPYWQGTNSAVLDKDNYSQTRNRHAPLKSILHCCTEVKGKIIPNVELCKSWMFCRQM